MPDLLPLIRQAVRSIKAAELGYLRDGLHRLRGKRSESVRIRTACYEERERKLARLRELLCLALPAGIAAGFSGEHVLAWVEKFDKRADRASYWNEACVDNSDSGAWHEFSCLFEKVESCLGMLAAWAAAVPPEGTERPGKGRAGMRHSADFTSVTWGETLYRFAKGHQAEAVRALWEAWEDGTPTLSQATIAERIGSSDDNFQLAKAFRRRKEGGGYEPHPAWGKMIRRAGKGTYCLVEPGAMHASNPA